MTGAKIESMMDQRMRNGEIDVYGFPRLLV